MDMPYLIWRGIMCGVTVMTLCRFASFSGSSSVSSCYPPVDLHSYHVHVSTYIWYGDWRITEHAPGLSCRSYRYALRLHIIRPGPTMIDSGYSIAVLDEGAACTVLSRGESPLVLRTTVSAAVPASTT